MTFRFSFDIEFDEYNADSDTDFTVGQCFSSNGRDYKLFTIRKDRKCLKLYARIKAKLRAEGKMLDDFDILIASVAIENQCVLVINNTKHFERIGCKSGLIARHALVL